MLNIDYIEGDSKLLEEVRHLWIKKRKYHEEKSTYFRINLHKLHLTEEKLRCLKSQKLGLL